MATRSIAPGVFREDEPPCLIGGRSNSSGEIVFPMPTGSEAALYEAVPLKRKGTLWSYTIQQFRPKTPPYKGPDEFEPFVLGYVELPGEVIVEARIVDVGFDRVRIGMPVELAVIPFSTDPDGTVVTTYAFRPAQEKAA